MLDYTRFQVQALSAMLLVESYTLLAVMFLSFLNVLAVKDLSSQIPYFEPRPNNVSFNVGETATLLCSVGRLHSRFVVWRKMSEPNPLTVGELVYSPDERIILRRVEDKNEWNLVIKDVDQEDAGVYECAVSSREKYVRLVFLRVNGEGRSRTKQSEVVMSGRSFVSKGSTIFLMCNATGDDYAPDGVDWFINGRIVNHNSFPRVRIYHDADYDKRTLYSTLEIKRSVMSDKGIYVCRGPDSKTAMITLHILDEEKSHIDKRGDESQLYGSTGDSTNSCSLLVWRKLFYVPFLPISTMLFTHIYFQI